MASSDLSVVLRAHKEAIVRRWVATIRRRSAAAHIDEARLRDALPVLLDAIAALTETDGEPEEAVGDPARAHAVDRLELAYTVDELVVEYVTLREAIHGVLSESGRPLGAEEMRGVDRGIDQALVDTIRRFVHGSERRLRAFERLSAEVEGASGLDALLGKLVSSLLESVPAIDTAAVLLVEGDRVVVRAARGLGRERELGMSVAFGEGFAGRIAATEAPLLVHDAARSSVLKSEILRACGVRALYGVPLVHAGKLIGVANIGSCRAYDFAADDMLLFRALVDRTVWAIRQAQLMEKLRATAAFGEQLVGIVSHDLRSPVHAIALGAASLERTPDLPEPARRTNDRVLRAAGNMGRMIEQLLDFTRTRLGSGIPVALRPMRLDEVCRDVIDQFRMAYSDRRFELASHGDTSGVWDPERLRQIVSNLVDNALVHGAAGAIEVSVVGGDDVVALEVHNAGGPIPSECLEVLFEPFRQAGPSRRGLGLGLFVAAEIARAHGGTIGVHTSEEGGTTFRVRLPRQPGEVTGAAEPRSVAAERPRR